MLCKGQQWLSVWLDEKCDLRKAAGKPGRALPLRDLLPGVLAVQPYSVTLMPAVEAQLR